MPYHITKQGSGYVLRSPHHTWHNKTHAGAVRQERAILARTHEGGHSRPRPHARPHPRPKH